LERRTIPKGSKAIFSKPLIPSPDLAARLSEVTYEDGKNLRWVVYSNLIADSKRRVLQAKYEQTLDEKKLFPVPRALKTMSRVHNIPAGNNKTQQGR
jgi:hypothetical protein